MGNTHLPDEVGQGNGDKPSLFDKGVRSGKRNMIFIGILIGIAVIWFNVQDHNDQNADTPAAGKVFVQKKTIRDAVAQDISTSFELARYSNESANQAEPPSPVAKVIKKRYKKPASTQPGGSQENGESNSSQTDETVENGAADQPATENTAVNDPSKNLIAFNLWSVAELRLRAAYTKLMNDSARTPAQRQEAQKEYLDLVNRRTKKCGQLDDKFASNINSIEKLTFNEKNVKTLDCHASENINELLRLYALGVEDS